MVVQMTNIKILLVLYCFLTTLAVLYQSQVTLFGYYALFQRYPDLAPWLFIAWLVVLIWLLCICVEAGVRRLFS